MGLDDDSVDVDIDDFPLLFSFSDIGSQLPSCRNCITFESDFSRISVNNPSIMRLWNSASLSQIGHSHVGFLSFIRR